MRNICLVAVLLALPFTAEAQTSVVAGRSTVPASGQRQSGQRQSDQRQSDQRQSDQRQSNQRQSDQGQSDRRPSDQRQSDQRQSDRRNDDQRHSGQRQAEPRPTTGLSPLGLPPAATPQMPWWEQRRQPSWEQKQVPSWERQQTPAWEMNRARTMLDQERDAKRLAKTPRPRPQHNKPPVVYVLPPYRYFPPYGYGYSTSTTYITPAPPEVVTQSPPPAALPETGLLRLEVEPRNALQIFVDGLYLGTPADLGDEIELPLGTRRIELRAPGYRTLVFDTVIVSDRSIVYRGALEPLANAPAPGTPAPTPKAPEAPVAPKAPSKSPMFLLPGCYMGNVMPTASMLREGCDLSKLQTISP